MGKNKNNRHYAKPVDETIPVDVKEDVVETVETTTVPEYVVGVVTGCERLNVRKQPVKEPGNIICEIKENSKVVIDEDASTADFYKVCTEAGIEGYCMKDHITIEQ